MISDTERQLRNALSNAADRFRFYQKQHLAKTPPDTKKADVNGLYADKLEEVLRLPPETVSDKQRAALQLCKAFLDVNGLRDYKVYALDAETKVVIGDVVDEALK